MNIYKTKTELDKLMKIFNRCFINHNWELILVPEHNIYFRLEDVNRPEDVKRKVIQYVSRYASKGIREKAQIDIMKKLNTYFGVDFGKKEWELIYIYLGNGCNDKLCRKFIEEEYDIKLLEEAE